jgi:hypothetical protein
MFLPVLPTSRLSSTSRVSPAWTPVCISSLDTTASVSCHRQTIALDVVVVRRKSLIPKNHEESKLNVATQLADCFPNAAGAVLPRRERDILVFASLDLAAAEGVRARCCAQISKSGVFF